MELKERCVQQIESIIRGLRQELTALPDGPEKETLEKALNELERIARDN